ncbi:glycoside hydrolase family 78 protein [Clostridium sp. SHJSY1]|uniref:alpha-L-rhamnosidase n=1 Tax=Clostridium sp. SHJSY1 TaxID=2942483 RepID=UPI00287546D6|nr:family 78 glycoside hydrolase catalytic domain [Clostridium sp. SHJSY1]MDS0525155.1 glycoside hydrolase family 78 protein [Clostridium sp. SHJSY1]
MKIIRMKTNHIRNPLGFYLGKPKFSYVVTDTNAIKQEAAQIEVALDEGFNEIVFDSGKKENIDSLGYELDIELKSYTRYYWRVKVWADNDENAVSDIAWFETGKIGEVWSGIWITPEINKDIHPVIIKEFNIEKKIKSARAYVCGLGLYEININNRKAGEEYLTPNCNAYDKWIQYQTYDIADSLKLGENKIEVMLGNGWYKGRFGFEGGAVEIYDDKFALLCDIVVNFEDGTNTIIKSDTTWKCRESKIKFSDIYDGEMQDDSFKGEKTYNVKEIELGYGRLKERLSLPVVIKEEIKPIEIIKTPLGETVLDMGQNMVGWIKFKTSAPKGTKIILEYGELLQEGNFYKDNLRTAKAKFEYISDGLEKEVRPYFTFYGFRYVKITGWIGEVKVEDFTGCVLYSDMETTGHIETSNQLVNKLFLNALWGQKGNFLDVPTDCPQRDERMGWTGDAQVFSGTAAFNMDTYAFFSKYGFDLYAEQKSFNGMVPMVVPSINMTSGGSSAWGDAATIIPWTMYLYHGDKRILENQFDSMKSWVDYIRRAVEKSGSRRLWTTGFHFGDWLALDGENPSMPTGGTEESYIASAYYCYSSMLVAKAAKVIGKEDISKEYETLSREIREAIIDEYFTKNGRLALKNQTAYIVALFMGLAPEEHKERVAKDLFDRISKDKGYLKTGFVGSPYICRVLSENGYNEMAYKLLLNKDYPSWLYPVTMGATTIWERWDSVLPDGKISGTDMNSLNHYAYGSIAEWMYRIMCGINPVEDAPGFRHVKLTPMPDYRFKYAKSSFNSPVGLYESGWNIEEDGSLEFKFIIPFNASATLILPHVRLDKLYVNGELLKESKLKVNSDESINLVSGTYVFKYIPTESYIKYYNINMSLSELLENQEVKQVFSEELKSALELPEDMIKNVGSMSIRELSHLPFFNVSEEEMNKTDEKLNKIKIDIGII